MAYRLTPLSVMVQLNPQEAKKELVRVLEEEKGDITATAQRLDVSRTCIYNWIGRLDISVSRPR